MLVLETNLAVHAQFPISSLAVRDTASLLRSDLQVAFVFCRACPMMQHEKAHRASPLLTLQSTMLCKSKPAEIVSNKLFMSLLPTPCDFLLNSDPCCAQAFGMVDSVEP